MADESMELQAAKRALKAAEEEAATARTRANIKPDDEEAQSYAKAAEAEEQRARERVNEVVNKEKSYAWPCFAVILGPVVVFLVWVLWLSLFGLRSGSGGGPVAAMQYCEHAVKQRLRSPGSGDFQYGHSTKVISLGNDKYRLRSFVDSQNAFGAQVRTHFVCEVQGGDSLDDFRVVKLEILE